MGKLFYSSSFYFICYNGKFSKYNTYYENLKSLGSCGKSGGGLKFVSRLLVCWKIFS